MKLLKDFVVALNFVSALIGAGLASGKEVVVFLGNANLFSVILCGVLIGIFSYPFIILGIKNNGDILGGILGKYQWIGNLIVKFINFIFLVAMLGGAEAILYQLLGIRYGAFIMAIVTLLLYELGNNFIKSICSITVPLVLVFLLVLYWFKNSKIIGDYFIISPLLYAGMNTTCAGIYAGNYCTRLNSKDASIICIIIAIFISLFLTMVRSIVVGAESQEIPLYSVAKDTNLDIFGAIIIISSILTSCLSSLKLAVKRKGMNAYAVCMLALVLSSIGFGNVIKFVYPFIGIVGLGILIIASIRALPIKLKFCKKLGLDL